MRGRAAPYIFYIVREWPGARERRVTALYNKARCETYVRAGHGPGTGSLASDASKDDRLRLENGR